MKAVIILKLFIFNVFKRFKLAKDHSGQVVLFVRSRTCNPPQRQMLVNVIIVFAKIIGVHVYAFSDIIYIKLKYN